MTDEELLRVAANKTSFIDVAQKILGDELTRRNLTAPGEAFWLVRASGQNGRR
jgi:hypothetical protein